jgi:hypothetical protein
MIESNKAIAMLPYAGSRLPLTLYGAEFFKAQQ